MDPVLVSVIVPYYKRPDAIGRCLDSIFQQEYPNREVILVDSQSEDNVESLIRARGHQIKLLELPDNHGVNAARNAGIQAAKGQILVFVDDDMGFHSPSELTKVVTAFEIHPTIHVLAFQVVDPDGKLRLREWCHPRYWKEFSETEFETHYFCEGACAFRRDVFDVCGGFYEPYFLGAESWDLVLRLLDRGFRILYCPEIRSWHRPSVKGRTTYRQFYYFTRSYVWTAYKDYHFPHGLFFLAPKLAMMLYFTVRTRSYRPFLRGIWDGIVGLKRVHNDRTPVNKATLRYVAELDKWRPSLRVRFGRHNSGVHL